MNTARNATARFAQAWRQRADAQAAYNQADEKMLAALTEATAAGATYPDLADATGREASPEQLRGYLRRAGETAPRPAVPRHTTPPPPDGWVALRDVAKQAGVTRQAVRYHLDRGTAGLTRNEWGTFVREGDGWKPGEGTRAPIFLRETAAKKLIDKIKRGKRGT